MGTSTDPRLQSHLVRIARALASEPAPWRPDPAREEAEYVLKDRIGGGGEGVVWLANQTALRRDVALKCPKVEHEAEFTARARAWGQLDHPNIVPVYDLATGMVEDRIAPVLAMKHVKGRPWSELLSERKGGGKAFDHVDVLLKVADALAYAHSRGVAHCDVKPANVLVGEYGEVLLADWGMLRICDAHDEELRALAAELPVAGGGTDGYMAPEQRSREHGAVGVRADVHALGVILRELIDGAGGCATGDIPGLCEVAARATRANPLDRHASAAEFAEELRAHLRGHHSRRRGEELAARATEMFDSLPPVGETRRHDQLRECERLLDESLRAWGDNASGMRLRAEIRRTTAETLRAEGALSAARAEAMRIEDEDVRRRLLGKISVDDARLRRRTLLMRGSVASALAAGALLVVVWGHSAIEAERAAADRARLQLAAEANERRRIESESKLEQERIHARDVASQRELVSRLAELQARETRLAERIRGSVPPPSSVVPHNSMEPPDSRLASALPELAELELERRKLAAQFGTPLPPPHRALVTARADAALAEDADAAAVGRAVEVYRALASEHPDDAEVLVGLAVALARRGNLVDADQAAKQAIDASESLDNPDDGLRARALSVAAEIQRELGDDERARAFDSRGLAILRESWERDTIEFADELVRAGLPGDAQQATAAWYSIASPLTHGTPRPEIAVRGMELMAEAQLDSADPEGALRTLDGLAAKFARKTGDPIAGREPVWAQIRARALVQKGELTEAEQLLRGALEELSPESGASRRLQLVLMSDLAAVVHLSGNETEAESIARRQLAMLVQAYGSDHPHAATARINLASMVSRQGRHEEAEALAREGLDGIRMCEGPGSMRVASATNTLGMVLLAANRNGEALECVRDAICLSGRRDSQPTAEGTQYWMNATTIAIRMGRRDLAHAFALEGFETTRRVHGDSSIQARRSAANLIWRARGSQPPGWCLCQERQRSAGVWMHRSLFDGTDRLVDLGLEAHLQLLGIRAILEGSSGSLELPAGERTALMRRAVALGFLARIPDDSASLRDFPAQCAARLAAGGAEVPAPPAAPATDSGGLVSSRELGELLDAIEPFPELGIEPGQPPQSPEGLALVAEFLKGCPTRP